jgi:Holliday junction resolvase RusA-like endonuclease
MSFLEIIHPPETKSNALDSWQTNDLNVTSGILTLEELAARIDYEHQQSLHTIALGLLHARNAGDYLLEAIALVEPEQWNTWLTDHCHLSEKTAITYMQIAQGWPNVNRLTQDSSHHSTALPKAKDDSEHPDVYLPNLKEGIDPPSVKSKTVLNPPVEEPTSATKFSPTDRPIDEVKTPRDKETKTETTTDSSPKIYAFWIPGKVTPKARPRVTKNGTFFPQRYREWRLRAQGEIIMQVQQMNPPPKLPFQEAALRILLCGNHRGDGDNAIGSVCDALVSAGVLPSDSLKYLPYGSWRHIKSETTGVKIEIKPLS